MNDQPQRRYALGIRVGADSYEDLRAWVRQLDRWLDEHDGSSSTHIVSGSPSVGWTAVLAVDKDMTHERYFEQCNEWLAANKDRSKAG